MAKIKHRYLAIRKLRKAGFKPLGASHLFYNNAIIFPTKEEADRAYQTFERDAKCRYIGRYCCFWLWPERFESERKAWKEQTGQNAKFYPCRK